MKTGYELQLMSPLQEMRFKLSILRMQGDYKCEGISTRNIVNKTAKTHTTKSMTNFRSARNRSSTTSQVNPVI